MQISASPDLDNAFKALNESVKIQPKDIKRAIITSPKNAYLIKDGHLLPKFRFAPNKISRPKLDDATLKEIDEPFELPVEDDDDFFDESLGDNCILRITFEEIVVKNDTTGLGADDVFVKIQSYGSEWIPVRNNVIHVPMTGNDETEWEIKDGDKREPKIIILEVKPDPHDMISAYVSAQFYEADFGGLDKALRKALSKLASTLASGAVAGAGGTIFAPLAGAAAGRLINDLIGLFGLGDDYMGSVDLSVFGRLDSFSSIDQLDFVPARPGSGTEYRYRKIDEKKIRLIRDMKAHGGHWRAEFLIEIICE